MVTQLIKISVSDLMEFREYDRIANPVPQVPFVHQYTMEQVVQWVKENGVAKPLELSVFKNKALLTDGNHRLAAASVMGIKAVDVVVKVYENEEEFTCSFAAHTIARFKPFQGI